MTKDGPQGSESRSCLCGACGAKFAKTREWQVFCSDKCRKESWKTNKMHTRRILQIEVRLARIEAKMGIKECHHEPSQIT